jgi:hypothetical protein
MIVVSLLAAAVLAHELLYVTRDGREYLDRCFVPTFGLQLSPRMHRWAHIALMVACAAMAMLPAMRLLHVVTFVLLTIVIASYSLRLSNHLVLAWFMFVVLLIADAYPAAEFESIVRSGFAALVVITYLLSFFHKLNGDFLSERRSQAAALARFHCEDRGITRPGFVRAASVYAIYSTLLFELLLPLLLLWPPTRAVGVVLAVLFHYSLALVGIVNFSAMMYAALAAFLPIDGWAEQHMLAAGAGPAIALCLATGVVTWLVTPRRAGPLRPYRHRNAAWLIQFAFAGLTAWLLLEAWWAMRQAPVSFSFDAIALQIAIAVYALNGLAPYAGLKIEFSIAMFSNLHGTRWNHLLVPARWRVFDRAEYLVVDRISGLPEPTDIASDEAAVLAHAVLSRPDAYEYRPYFFFEALKRISDSSRVRPFLDVVFRFRGRCYAIGNGAVEPPPEFPKWSRVNTFPFVLPFDADAPHSEQGSIATRDRNSALF